MPTGPVALHDLRYLDEGDRVVVGRTDCDSYGVFPPDGAALLRELDGGRAPQDAAVWYTDRYGEPVDIDEFLDTLRDLDFLSPDGTAEHAAPPRWQKLGVALFSPVAWAGYAALVVVAVAVCVADPRLAPARGNVFFTDYLLIVELTILFGQLPFVVLHELFHLLAGRRLGLHSSMHLGHRLYFLVAETKLRRGPPRPAQGERLGQHRGVAGLAAAAGPAPRVQPHVQRERPGPHRHAPGRPGGGDAPHRRRHRADGGHVRRRRA
ncbi:hypothetical protein ACFPIJ_45250 [Dactylosporangium cerinum]|uniref:Uncharacterized protein n=1 Tax=Dactylosporangium cerinum TaxID=1434730 RepID=A0ABV9WCM5_9ACTN